MDTGLRRGHPTAPDSSVGPQPCRSWGMEIGTEGQGTTVPGSVAIAPDDPFRIWRELQESADVTGATTLRPGPPVSDLPVEEPAGAPMSAPEPGTFDVLDEPRLVITDDYIGVDRRRTGVRAGIGRFTYGRRRNILRLDVLIVLVVVALVVGAALLVTERPASRPQSHADSTEIAAALPGNPLRAAARASDPADTVRTTVPATVATTLPPVSPAVVAPPHHAGDHAGRPGDDHSAASGARRADDAGGHGGRRPGAGAVPVAADPRVLDPVPAHLGRALARLLRQHRLHVGARSAASPRSTSIPARRSSSWPASSAFEIGHEVDAAYVEPAGRARPDRGRPRGGSGQLGPRVRLRRAGLPVGLVRRRLLELLVAGSRRLEHVWPRLPPVPRSQRSSPGSTRESRRIGYLDNLRPARPTPVARRPPRRRPPVARRPPPRSPS